MFAPIFVVLLGFAVLVVSIAILREWRFEQLRWKQLTVVNCQRYLHAHGWTTTGSETERVNADKGSFHITINCAGSNPTSLISVKSLLDERINDGRHYVVFVPDAIQDGVIEEMLRLKVSVIPYKQLRLLEDVLLSHQELMNRLRAEEIFLMTESLEAPIKKKLLENKCFSVVKFRLGFHDYRIAATDNVQCYFRDGGGHKLLITFNDSWQCGVSSRFHKDVDYESINWSVLDFITSEPNWFPADDMSTLIPIVMGCLDGRFPVRLGLGFSQGGYGVIKYSRKLLMTAVAAASPQFSIDNRLIDGRRFAGHFRPHLNLGMGIKAGDCICPTYVFYDPYDQEDAEQIKLLRTSVNIREIRMPFASHTRRMIDNLDTLRDLLTACERGEEASLYKLGSVVRRSNPGKAYLIALEVSRRRPTLATKILAKNSDIWSLDQQADLLYRIAAAGEADAAFQLIKKIAAVSDNSASVQGCAALVAHMACAPHAARTFIERALELDANNAHWRYVESLVKASV